VIVEFPYRHAPHPLRPTTCPANWQPPWAGQDTDGCVAYGPELRIKQRFRLGVVSTPRKRLSIVFVCTGNICRSPMAEIIFSDALRQEGLAHRVQVSSAGTGNWHVGNPADPRTVEALRRAGFSSEHVAAQLGAQHLSADLLVALDRGHLTALRRVIRDPDRVMLLRSFDRAAGQDLDVPDPYYGGKYGFDEVLSMVRAAMPGLLAWVRERL
jgi:protein-tyrosine phosphatase